MIIFHQLSWEIEYEYGVPVAIIRKSDGKRMEAEFMKSYSRPEQMRIKDRRKLLKSKGITDKLLLTNRMLNDFNYPSHPNRPLPKGVKIVEK